MQFSSSLLSILSIVGFFLDDFPSLIPIHQVIASTPLVSGTPLDLIPTSVSGFADSFFQLLGGYSLIFADVCEGDIT